MRISNENLLNVSVPSMDSDFQLRPVWLGHIAQYAIQLTFSGTPDGTFSLQCSNDPGNPNAQAQAEQYEGVDHWTTITGSATVVSAAGDITWNAENVGYRWVRVAYVSNNPGGVLETSVANLKGI